MPLSKDLGRHFLYARYNVELTDEGLAALGISGIAPKDLRKMDSVEHIDALRHVGLTAGEQQVSLDHLGPFAPQQTPA